MKALIGLVWVICAGLVIDAFGADPSASKPAGQSPSQPSSVAPPAAGVQSPAAPSVKKVLVDDTVSDAQLRQILAKGYRPTEQVPGHEVSYCRREQLSGGRFVTTVCKTAARILEDEQRGKDLLSSVERIGLQTGK